MRNEYTDERLPGVTLVNMGGCLFEVQADGAVVSTFTTWEKPGGKISEAFAAQMAADYFDSASVPRDAVALLEAEQEKTVRTFKTDEREFNAPASDRSRQREIDALMAREKLETDPEKKKILRRNALHLMAQEESVAQALVSYLTEDAR